MAVILSRPQCVNTIIDHKRGYPFVKFRTAEILSLFNGKIKHIVHSRVPVKMFVNYTNHIKINNDSRVHIHDIYGTYSIVAAAHERCVGKYNLLLLYLLSVMEIISS